MISSCVAPGFSPKMSSASLSVSGPPALACSSDSSPPALAVKVAFQQPGGVLVVRPAVSQQLKKFTFAQVRQLSPGHGAFQDLATHGAGVMIQAHFQDVAGHMGLVAFTCV